MNYTTTKIYKIWSTQGDKIYIGATTKKYLCSRLAEHKHNYKLWKNKLITKCYSFDIFDKYGVDNCHIVLLESFNAIDKNQLNQKELFYIKNNNCVNKYLPGRTKNNIILIIIIKYWNIKILKIIVNVVVNILIQINVNIIIVLFIIIMLMKQKIFSLK